VSRYRSRAAEKAHYPVSLLCRALGVSRASCYAWHDRGPSARERADQQLIRQISKIHRASRGTYGDPRVHAELREDYGMRVGRKRVARLLRDHGLVGCHRRRRRGLTRPDPQATPPRTWSGGCSTRARPTGPGSLTSATSPPSRAGCTWLPSWTAAPARWSAGRWPTRQAARTAIYEYLEVFYNRRVAIQPWAFSAPPSTRGGTTSSTRLFL
jgi:transposase InsO family protein